MLTEQFSIVRSTPDKISTRVMALPDVEVSHSDPLRGALCRKRGPASPESQKRECDPPRYGFSTDVTLHVALGDDATARITPLHDPLKTAGPALSMERVYRCGDGTFVACAKCFTRGLLLRNSRKPECSANQFRNPRK